MTVLISQYTVYLFGVVIVALSVWGVVVPNRLIALVTGFDEQGFGPLRSHRLPSCVGRGADRRGPSG